MNRQTLLIGVLSIAALIAIYLWSGGSLPFAGQQGESQIEAEFAGVLAEIARLHEIKLDTAVVRSEQFKRLSLPTLPAFPDVRSGDRNPFLPF